MLSIATPPPGITTSLPMNAVTPPANGSASSTLTVTLGPLVTAGSYTPTVIATASGLTLSAPAVVTVIATAAGIENVIGAMIQTGCIDNAGIANSLSHKLATAAAIATGGDLRRAAKALNPLISHVVAQSGKHITSSCATALVDNLHALRAGWDQP